MLAVGIIICLVIFFFIKKYFKEKVNKQTKDALLQEDLNENKEKEEHKQNIEIISENIGKDKAENLSTINYDELIKICEIISCDDFLIDDFVNFEDDLKKIIPNIRENKFSLFWELMDKNKFSYFINKNNLQEMIDWIKEFLNCCGCSEIVQNIDEIKLEKEIDDDQYRKELICRVNDILKGEGFKILLTNDTSRIFIIYLENQEEFENLCKKNNFDLGIVDLV